MLTVTENGRIVGRTNPTSHDQVFVAVSVNYLHSSELICLSIRPELQSVRDDMIVNRVHLVGSSPTLSGSGCVQSIESVDLYAFV